MKFKLYQKYNKFSNVTQNNVTNFDILVIKYSCLNNSNIILSALLFVTKYSSPWFSFEFFQMCKYCQKSANTYERNKKINLWKNEKKELRSLAVYKAAKNRLLISFFN